MPLDLQIFHSIQAVNLLDGFDASKDDSAVQMENARVFLQTVKEYLQKKIE